MKEGKKEHQLKRKNTGEESPHPHEVKRGKRLNLIQSYIFKFFSLVDSESAERSLFMGNVLSHASAGPSKSSTNSVPLLHLEPKFNFTGVESESRTSIAQVQEPMVVEKIPLAAVEKTPTIEKTTCPAIKENAPPVVEMTPTVENPLAVKKTPTIKKTPTVERTCAIEKTCTIENTLAIENTHTAEKTASTIEQFISPTLQEDAVSESVIHHTNLLSVILFIHISTNTK
jgi:hypothetical protein